MNKTEYEIAFEQAKKELWKSTLWTAGLSKDEINYSLEDYTEPNEQQQAAVEKVKSNLKSWFVFYGPNGTGKSHLAILVLINRVKRNPMLSVKYITAFRMLLDIQTDWQQSEILTEYYGSFDILVIDEFEKNFETKSENEIKVLSEIFDLRNRHDRQTIIITNSWAEAKERLTPAAYDRISSRAIAIKFEGKSFRK